MYTALVILADGNAQSLVIEPTPLKVIVAIRKLKRCRLQGTDKILVELIQAGADTLCCDICKLIVFGISKKLH
jgi:hypothetical protein